MAYLATIPSYGLQVSRGLVPNVEAFRKFGANIAIGTSEVQIAGVATLGPYMPTTAVKVEAVSSDANDTAAGTGAQQITIFGLDENFNEVSEVLTMAGTSATSDSAYSYATVYRAYVSRVGTYAASAAAGSNIGAITVRGGTGTPDIVIIAAGLGQTQTSHYTVPAGHSLYISNVHLSVGSAKAVDLKWYQRPNANDVATPFTGARRLVSFFDGVLGQVDFEYSDAPIKFSEYTDIWFTGIVAATTGSASVEYSGVLVTD
jgi:hypothetical protein